MKNERVEIASELSPSEKRVLREWLLVDRRAGNSSLYFARFGDMSIYDAVRQAMMRLRRTLDVRYTHVGANGSECPCFSRKHATGEAPAEI